METNTTITYVYPPQPQVVVNPQVQIPQVVSVRPDTRGVQKSVGLGVSEIILRAICSLLCLAMLIAAAVAISAINDLDDYAGEYRHANDYRGAAGWLVFVAIVAIIYHGFMIFIRILYFTPIIDSFFSGYSFANAVLCVLFGISLLAGGISNAVYSSDNRDLYDDSTCSYRNGYYIDNIVYDICDDLQTVYEAQGAAAAFAFMSLGMFIILLAISLMNGVRKMQESSSTGYGSSDFSVASPYVPLSDNDDD